MNAPSLMNDFSKWLDKALSRKLPPDTRAFNFNLYEGTDSWDFEIIGTESFNPDNPDWACDPMFSHPELFYLPQSVVGNQWEQGLAAGIELVATYIRSGKHREVLRSAIGVGIGFVDGDLTVVWPETAA